MTKTLVRDLAKRRHVLRIRIYNDERKLAIAYPDQAEQLERNLEAERAQLAELDAHLQAAKEQVREELRSALDAYFDARDVLLKLNGYVQDPGFRDQIFLKPYLSRPMVSSPVANNNQSYVDPQPTLEVKDALLRVADMKPAPDLQVSETQRLHEERLRNERAGRGPWTDDELAQMAENPIEFHHGRGARVIPMVNQGGGSDA